MLKSSAAVIVVSSLELKKTLLVGRAELNAASPMCSERTVLLMEPSELHMHERGRRDEPLRHLTHFAQTRRTETRRDRLHLIFSSCWQVHVHRPVSGFSRGWMGPLIVNVLQLLPFQQPFKNTGFTHTLDPQAKGGTSRPSCSGMWICPVRPSVFVCSKARAANLTLS